jgi:hypothetical protein
VDKYTWVDIGSSYVMSDVLVNFFLPNWKSGPAFRLGGGRSGNVTPRIVRLVQSQRRASPRRAGAL